MIKKLLIALVAFSFLIGNFAFADNPPVNKDYSAIAANQIDVGPLLPAIPLKPAADTCNPALHYMCSGPDPYVVFAFGPDGSPFTDFMERFSPINNEECVMTEVSFYLFDLTAFGFPPVTGDLVVTIYSEDPDFPDYPLEGAPGILYQTTILNASIAYYPTPMYVTIPGGITFQGADLFVGVGSSNAADDIGPMCEDKLIANGGTCASDEADRGLAYYPPYAYHAFINQATSDPANFAIFAYICCELPAYTCPGNQDWPTFMQNYGRNGYTTNTIGDLTNFRKLWVWQETLGTSYARGNPVIKDSLVYIMFYKELVALRLYGPAMGTPKWRTSTHTNYQAFMWAATISNRCTPTVEGERIYFGTGSQSTNQGFVCANALTGDTIWVRHPSVGSGLVPSPAGQTRWSTSVIIGDNVYFGTSYGYVFCLDKLTGATVWTKALDLTIWHSPSTDGTDIFVGTSDGGGVTLPGIGGTVWKLRGTNGDSLWAFAGRDALLEGFPGAPVYSAAENALYVNSILGIPTGTTGTIDGLVTKINAADGGNVWGGSLGTLAPNYTSPNLLPFPWEKFVIGGAPSAGSIYYWNTNTALSTTRQYTFNGSLTWVGRFDAYYAAYASWFWDISDNSFASTCDPYTFAGYSLSNKWRILNANTGLPILTYRFNSPAEGNAIAEIADHDYVIMTTLGVSAADPGKVFCFDIGPNRPRLFVGATGNSATGHRVISLPSVSFVDPNPTARSADVFQNIGSATLNYTISLDDGAKAMVSMGGMGSGLSKIAKEMERTLLEDDTYLPANAGEKQSAARLALAPPTFVTLPPGSSTGTLDPGETLTQQFLLNPTVMNRGQNPFLLRIDTDDPDYLPEDATAYPHAAPQDIVTIIAIKGYDFCDGYVDFGTGTNTAYATNAGYNSFHGTPTDAFMIDDIENYLYHHSYFYGYELGNVAWVEEAGNTWNHFEANSLCNSGTFNDSIYDGATKTYYSGDVFSASFIDSLKDQTTGDFNQEGTIGMEMFVKQYGGFHEKFANFAYIYVELKNRGNDPIPADLYWGTYADWDIANSGNNVPLGPEGGVLSNLSAYSIGCPEVGSEGQQYGMGFVPLKGNLFKSGAPTVGAYGSVILANDPVVYNDLIVDSIYRYVNECPPYTDSYYPGTTPSDPGQDLSAILIADKKFVDGKAVLKGGIVMFGFTNSTVPSDDVLAAMHFANKFAGFGRGDVNDDNVVNLLDLCILNAFVNCQGPAPYPFVYLGDVNADGLIDGADVTYLYNYLFASGPLPTGDFIVR